ncbi:MAG TPA: hypothetical protein PL157_03480, partial [Acidobacteriota bacterium]|nr:hypothetical protein [Acidobacteriota bacterium]
PPPEGRRKVAGLPLWAYHQDMYRFSHPDGRWKCSSAEFQEKFQHLWVGIHHPSGRKPTFPQRRSKRISVSTTRVRE